MRGDFRSTATGFAGFFFLLCAISVLRPVRDQAGIARGAGSLPDMFAATFLGVLAGALLLAWIAAHVPRASYVPLAYRTFASGLLIAWLALRAEAPWAHAALFVWCSAWSLLAVSLFWSLLTEAFWRGAAARSFGVIAAGGTAGTLAGPLLVQWLARPLGPVNLVPLSAALLELSVLAASQLRRNSDNPLWGEPRRLGIRPALDALLRSDVLRALCGYVLLFTATATLLYVQQARMVAGASGDPRERTVLFARLDLTVAAVTLLVQAFVARPVLQRAGLRASLSLLPLLTAAGFAALARAPSLALVAAAQGLRKATHFGLERPGREALLTALDREEKYAPKAFVDAVVYRGGDALAAWLSQALPPAALCPAALALCAVWLINALWLARAAQARQRSAR